jgi:hypothetical protein
VAERETLVFPQDYKFSGDPVPFTFTYRTTGDYITRLVGSDVSSDHAERAGVRGKVLDWLRVNGPATKTAMKQAGLAQWSAIEAALEWLSKDGKVDSGPGRKAGSLRYFVPGEPSAANPDDTRAGATVCA